MSTKLVRFDIYCKTCQYEDKAEADDPCFDCLAQPDNEDSIAPIHYKADKKKVEKLKKVVDSL